LVLAPVPHHLAAIEKLLPQGSRAHPAKHFAAKSKQKHQKYTSSHLHLLDRNTSLAAHHLHLHNFFLPGKLKKGKPSKQLETPKTLPSALNQPVLWQVCQANRSLPFGYALRRMQQLTDEPRATCSTCWIVAPIYPKSNGKTESHVIAI